MEINYSFDCNNRKGHCDIINLFNKFIKKQDVEIKCQSDGASFAVPDKMKEETVIVRDNNKRLISDDLYTVDYANNKIILIGIMIDKIYISYETLSSEKVMPEKIVTEFYFYWTGQYNVVPFSFEKYGLIFYREYFGFTTGNNDVFGISALGLEKKWHHVYAVFNINDINQNKIYIDGELKISRQRTGTPIQENLEFSSNSKIGCNYSNDKNFDGYIDEVRIWTKEKLPGDVIADMHNLVYENSLYYDELIGYYRFDENSDKIKDYSKYNRYIYMVGGLYSRNTPDISGYGSPQSIIILNPISEIKKNTEYKLAYKIIPPSPTLEYSSSKMFSTDIDENVAIFEYEINKTEWQKINNVKIW